MKMRAVCKNNEFAFKSNGRAAGRSGEETISACVRRNNWVRAFENLLGITYCGMTDNKG